MNLYPFGKAVSYAIVRCLFKLRYEGTENVPEGGGYIIACNHRCYFDPLLLAYRVPAQIRYIAKAELTRIPLLGFFLKRFGIIPVKRGEGDNIALSKAADLIQEGGILGIFPEGTRSKSGVPLRPRSGIAIIAGKTGADILPAAVSFSGKLRFRSAITVRFGKMIPNSDLGIDLASPSTLRTASRLVMDKIIALTDKVPSPEEGAQ